jgi:ribosomal protein S18 acetylase RimI-like enzyme
LTYNTGIDQSLADQDTGEYKYTTMNISPYLRPINLNKDLLAVADLVELCFAETLDDDGRSFIRNMRRSAKNPRYLGASNRLTPSLTGYVWKQDNRLVGNLSLIPIVVENRKSYLIANVAVHPDYRGRGIARALTEAAIEMIRKRRVTTSWLQVRDDNQAAIHLYESFGFTTKAHRTVWHSRSSLLQSDIPAGHKITNRRRMDWGKQKQALKQLYPSTVRWNLPLDIEMFSPGVIGSVWRGFSENTTRQWSLRRHGSWTASLSYQSSRMQADWLWLAAPSESRGIAIQSLLPHARKVLGTRRTLALNYPAGEDCEALESVGFHPHLTLIWMQAE